MYCMIEDCPHQNDINKCKDCSLYHPVEDPNRPSDKMNVKVKKIKEIEYVEEEIEDCPGQLFFNFFSLQQS